MITARTTSETSAQAGSDTGRADVFSTHASDVYCYAVRRGGIDSLETAAGQLGISAHETFTAVTRLMELRLLRTDSTAPARLVPVSPDHATAQLVSPIERFVYEQRERMDQLRESVQAVARAHENSPDPVGTIARLEGAAEVGGLLKLAADVCRDEILILRGGDEEAADDLLDPCYGVLDRNVVVRVLCPHRSRASFATRAKAKRLVDRGAVIHTLSYVRQSGVVFDRSTAVMFSLPEDENASLAARQVHDADVVQFLTDMFEQLWEGASPFMTSEAGYAEATDDLHQSIVRLLAQGFTDEVVARKLGMSVRTCRRHISALLRNLDSVSRFQAGVQAAQRYAFQSPQSA